MCAASQAPKSWDAPTVRQQTVHRCWAAGRKRIRCQDGPYMAIPAHLKPHRSPYDIHRRSHLRLRRWPAPPTSCWSMAPGWLPDWLRRWLQGHGKTRNSHWNRDNPTGSRDRSPAESGREVSGIGCRLEKSPSVSSARAPGWHLCPGTSSKSVGSQMLWNGRRWPTRGFHSTRTHRSDNLHIQG